MQPSSRPGSRPLPSVVRPAPPRRPPAPPSAPFARSLEARRPNSPASEHAAPSAKARPETRVDRAELPAATANRPERAPREVSPLREDELGAFRPALAVLQPPSVATAAPLALRAPEQVQRMAEQVVQSLRVGAVGRGAFEARITLQGASQLEVRVRHEDGALRAVVLCDAGDEAEAQLLSRAVSEALGARGVAIEAVDVERR